jgi:hypothetical protein
MPEPAGAHRQQGKAVQTADHDPKGPETCLETAGSADLESAVSCPSGFGTALGSIDAQPAMTTPAAAIVIFV